MTKSKIPTLGEKMEEHGIGGGFSDDGLDLEGVKVSELAEDARDFVIYGATEMDSQFDEGKVFAVQIGDDKEATHKFWSSHAALTGKLRSMVEHKMFPVATKILKKTGKSGREYYDFQ